MQIRNEIDRVFRLEIDTLVKVRERLDGAYVQAVELMLRCSGHVVVTGMGKSAIIAQKIASTMSSTGTPSVYLHSGDGMHGDVGIVRAGDVVLAISKSGETEEIINILAYLNHAGIAVVSITASPESTLAKASDVVLFTPVDEEACPLNLAPTSSTTAALVVGDALAMSLMKMRDFQPEHFAVLHPGGQIGKRLLLTVADIMRTGGNNPVIGAGDAVKEMLSELTSKRCGAVSVIDGDGKLLGLITDFDIRKILEQGRDIFSVSNTDIMNRDATHIYSNEKAVEALDLMENREKPFLVLPVLDQGTQKVVGMLHLHDLVAKGL